MNVTAIHLLRLGDHAVVRAEIDGRWVTVIREYIDSPFSHIVEEGGMSRCDEAVREIEALMGMPV